MDEITIVERGITYRVEPVEEGGYFAEVLGVPGCITEGRHFDETLENIRDAFALYLAAAEAGEVGWPKSRPN